VTRICTRCKTVIGEKCARCGSEAIPLKTNPNGQAVTGTEFDCSSCGHHFPQGEGGETGGMCEPCFDAELRMAHEQAMKSHKRRRGENDAHQQG
jgi:uncharacterized spore protein YtfJ